MRWMIALPLRVLNAVIAWWWYWMEFAADGVVGLFVKKEYVRTGSCNRCGRCCQLLAVEMPRWLAARDRLAYLVSRWHDLVLNFEFRGRTDRWLVYRCRYYRAASDESGPGRCSIHPFRPRLCRFYPRNGLYGHPKLHRACGFSFVRRDGRPTFAQVLDERHTRKSA